MITRSQKIRLGIFITVALTILIAVVFVLSFNRFLKEQDTYHVAYTNVSVMGLDVGSSVKYLGLNVGTVQNIRIDPDDISRIIVTIGLQKDTPIKNDVRADITTIGITGIKIIELRGGTNEAGLLQPGSFINAGKSLTEDITGKAEVIAEKFELILNNLIELTSDINQAKIFKLVDSTALTINEFNNVLRQNQHNINSAFANFDLTMQELALAGQSANSTMNQLDQFVSSDSIKMTLDNIAEIADKLNKANIYNLDEQITFAVDQVNSMLTQMDLLLKLNSSKINQTMDGLNEAVHTLNNAARQIDEDPSILLGGTRPDNPPDDKLEK